MHSNTVQDSSVRIDISATASIEALPRMMEPQIDKRQTDLLFALPAMIFGHAICEVVAQSLRSGPHARVSGHCRKSSSMMVVTFRVLGSKRTIAFFSNGVRRVSTQDRQRVNAQVKKSGRCLC